MLNNRQIEIADILLKKLKSGDIVTNSYSRELEQLGYTKTETVITTEILINDYKLIYYHVEIIPELKYNSLALTSEGNKAESTGIKKYIDVIESDKELDRQVKISTVKTSKLAIGISFTSLVIAIAIPFLVEKCKNDMSTKTDPKNQVYERNSCENGHNCNKHVEHTNFPNKLTDPFLIEKLKDSLKHDTKFLNELKLELKRKPIDN